jgi:uncharacterized protein YndB with AHSA1/START domain
VESFGVDVGVNMRPGLLKDVALGVSVAAGLLAMNCLSAHAAVLDQQPNGFAIEETAQIAATPDAVYAALIHPQAWWNSQHTFSRDAANLSLDAKAGGCLCETLPGGGSVQHLTVVYADPARTTIRFRGAMGPFQGLGVDGALTITLAAKDGGTALVLDNNYGGYIKGGFGKWPDAADGMLTDLVAHLKFYAETGKAMPPEK